MNNKKLLVISPHLSTGGLPAYLLYKINLLKDVYDIYVIEFSYLGTYDVQRKQIEEILGNKFIPVYENEEAFRLAVERVSPDIIWFEEHPEKFFKFSDALIDYVYSYKSKCTILETTHGSDFTLPDNRHWYPHKFMWVSKFHLNKYKNLLQPQSVLEYSLPPHKRDDMTRNSALSKLGMDEYKKHVLCVGLLSPHKNQGYAVELARMLPDVVFNFVGNMADNYKHYWEDVKLNSPSNCRWWGERKDVDLFMQGCDVLLHPSTLELNPLVLYEALSYRLPIVCNRMDTFAEKYDDHPMVWYIIKDDMNATAKLITNILKV